MIKDWSRSAQSFKCQNADCGKSSPVRDVEWFKGTHVVECPHCGEWNQIRQVATPCGEQFEVVGLVKSD
jgi:hypothetical protein